MSNLQVIIAGLDFAPLIVEYPSKIVIASPQQANIAEDTRQLRLIDNKGEYANLFNSINDADVQVTDDYGVIFNGNISSTSNDKGVTTITVKTEMERALTQIGNVSMYSTSAELILNHLLGSTLSPGNGSFNMYADPADNIIIRELVTSIQTNTSLRVYWDEDKMRVLDANFTKPINEVDEWNLTAVPIKKEYKVYDSYAINYLGDGGVPVSKIGDNSFSAKIDATSNFQANNSVTAELVGETKINLGIGAFTLEMSTDYDYVQIGDWGKFKYNDVYHYARIVSYTRKDKKLTVEVITNE